MELMVLAGVWALAFGHLTITHSLKFKGNDARAFGAALIIAAAYGLPHINKFVGGYLPGFAAGNDALRTAYTLLIGAAATYATAWVMTQVYPKLRIPSVSLSIKRKRAA